MNLEKISRNGIFQIVALDHRESLKKLLNQKEPESVKKETLEKIKLKFSKIFSPHASGILLDPTYGKPAIQSVKNKCGILISLEKSGYVETKEGRITQLISNFTPKKALEMGANAAKLLIYFNPKAKASEKQKELVKNVVEKCEKVGLPLVCEFLVYPHSEKNFEKEKSKLILDSVKELSEINFSLLKVEFPGDVKREEQDKLEERCEKITNLSKVPWVLLSRGVEFDEFKRQLAIAMKCGCSGFMIGRALWQEYFRIKKGKEKFLQVECVKRLKELKEITSNQNLISK